MDGWTTASHDEPLPLIGVWGAVVTTRRVVLRVARGADPPVSLWYWWQTLSSRFLGF